MAGNIIIHTALAAINHGIVCAVAHSMLDKPNIAIAPSMHCLWPTISWKAPYIGCETDWASKKAVPDQYGWAPVPPSSRVTTGNAEARITRSTVALKQTRQILQIAKKNRKSCGGYCNMCDVVLVSLCTSSSRSTVSVLDVVLASLDGL